MDVQSGNHLTELPWRRSLAARLSRAFILVVVLSLVVVGVMLIWIAHQTQKKTVFLLQERNADKVAMLISSYVGHAVENLTLFEGIESLSTMTPAEQKMALENLIIQRRTLFSQFVLIDKDGTEMTKVSQFHTFLPGELESQADTDAFMAAIGGMPYIGPVFISPDSGLLSVRIAVPISAPGKRNVGVLAAEMNVARLWQEISRIKIGQTSYAYLVDTNGRFIAYQEPAEVLQRYGEDMTKMPPVAKFVDREPEDVQHVHEYVGLSGERVIGRYVPIQGTDWAVVIEMSTREAYAGVNRMQWALMGLTILGIMVAGALGFTVSQRFSRPIRALTISAQRIGEGDLDAKVVEVRRQDEIGVLARTFNRMVENIKQSAEALRASEEKYRGIFENSVEGIFQSTLDGHFLSVNPAMARIHGYGSPEEMILNVTDIGQQLYADSECREEFIRLLEQGSVKNFEAQLYRKDGSIIWVSLNARALYDERGKQDYLEGIVLDITERKKADEALKNYSERLEEMVKERTQELESAQEELVKHERLAVLGQLTGMVSHELRNPLGVICTSTFYLNNNLKDSDEKITKHLKRIEEQVGLCDSIVNELLEFTRGRRSEMVEADLNLWLKEVLDQITVPDQVSLARELSPGLPMLPFDRDKLQRVVINLVNNAVHAVIDRHERFKQEDELYQPQVKVATFMVEDGVCIEVEDNGIGMDEETAGQAFEPLFTTSARGTGLGLAIVKKIAEEHGGTVSIESEPDRGTKAIVEIPSDPQWPPESANRKSR